MNYLSSLEKFLDVPELLDRVENDEELLAELFLLFQEDLPGSRVALQSAIQRADSPEIEKAAHRIKGMLANLSCKEAASLAAGMELAARARDFAEIHETMAALDSQIQAISCALQTFTMELNS